MREAIETALTAAGLHAADGGDLWLLYECIELRLFCGAAAVGHLMDQAERVRALYRRRLAVPLMDMEAAHTRYTKWAKLEAAKSKGGHEDDGGAAATLDRTYAAASREMARRRKLELRLRNQRNAGPAAASANPWALADEDGGAWPLWEQYLELEGTDDPWRARLLFERLLAPGETDAASRGGGDICRLPGRGRATFAS